MGTLNRTIPYRQKHLTLALTLTQTLTQTLTLTARARVGDSFVTMPAPSPFHGKCDEEFAKVLALLKEKRNALPDGPGSQHEVGEMQLVLAQFNAHLHWIRHKMEEGHEKDTVFLERLLKYGNLLLENQALPSLPPFTFLFYFPPM